MDEEANKEKDDKMGTGAPLEDSDKKEEWNSKREAFMVRLRQYNGFPKILFKLFQNKYIFCLKNVFIN